MRLLAPFLCVFPGLWSLAAPALLDKEFELPEGFHIYRAAGPELSGGSYDLAFDGQGRLLVGDGNAVRRLNDADGDGVFDSFEVIATGLGWRGPQGLLVHGGRLYAVGGDGIQVFEGYGSEAGLVHKGRLGQPFKTGGDHEAHTILRGHDGYLYFVSGDGGGTRDRVHITESNSPVIFERAASVFRISRDGKAWECLSAGGRNPPNLGQNYLGELFSFDSDMEWHVGLPWWRPVRLNHWLVGGDQGWQEVGAYPPYYIDCLPGVLDVGRGSPTWGVFYEHYQFPERYHDSFLVCDYRWKRESNDQYHTTGRLVAFHLRRARARWEATMETFARPRPGARDETGKPISFALVDVEVAPDGSVFLSDHNQGIWRIMYSIREGHFSKMLPGTSATDVERLLDLPQPASEWSRLAEEDLKTRLGPALQDQLHSIALDSSRPLKQRLRAIRLLSPDFRGLPMPFMAGLATNDLPEIRGQAAWLFGLRGEAGPLTRLLTDDDSFVRRRAAEALTRGANPPIEPLLDAMGDSERIVRYAAMAALAHRPTSDWFSFAAGHPNPQVRMRGLVAAKMRRELPPDTELRAAIMSLLAGKIVGRENYLDLLRVLGIFRQSLGDKERAEVSGFLLNLFLPYPDAAASFEQARLLGEYQVTAAFGALLKTLEAEGDHVRQFHFAQAVARLSAGWSAEEESRLLDWFIKQQQGWFADFSGKGVEFPQFWATVLADVGKHHGDALLKREAQIDLAGLLGGVYLDLVADRAYGAQSLMQLHAKATEPKARSQIVRHLARLKSSGQQHWQIVANTFLDENDPDLSRACADFLARPSADCDDAMRERISQRAVQQLERHNSLVVPMNRLLTKWSGTNATVKFTGERADPAARERLKTFWRQWFEATFGKSAIAEATRPERDDAELQRLILQAAGKRGDPDRGGQIYEALQCHTCHSGGVNPGREGRIFGPDLAGVTRRLSRVELADSLVYPSKQVPDRFKGYELTLKDGTVLTGFITEQNEEFITFADRDQVHRIERSKIQTLTLQNSSLMPEKLLGRLSDSELYDLLAFLER